MIYRSPYPDVEIPEVSLPQFMFQRVEAWPEKAALIDGPTGRSLSYKQVAGGAQKLAAGLAARGFSKGDVFAIYSPNLPEYALVFFGVALAGGVNTTVNPLYTAEELTHQLRDAGARYLMTIPQLLDTAQEAAARSDVEEVFVFGEGEGATPFMALLQHDFAPPQVEIDPKEDLVALPYSSGTTGLPKGVMLTHYNLVANISQCEPIEKIEASDTTIGILPFYHIYGMVVILSMALRNGATVVTMPRFELDQFLALVQDYAMENLYLVPPIVLALGKHPMVNNYDLSAVQYITSGAAPLPPSVAKACAERLGCVVKQGYGMTELSPVSHITPREGAVKLASSGVAVPNTEFRVVEVGTDDDVAPGEKGELWVRGPQVMKGYLDNEQATRNTIDEDGWLHTGDVATVDEDGYVYIVDRVKELIKYKGYQVAPAEVEAVVQGHPAVADAAVIPSPDEEAGEVPKAFVVLRSGQEATPDDIMAFVAERIAPYKKVRRLEFVDEIPKTGSGKILRRELVTRERAATAE